MKFAWSNVNNLKQSQTILFGVLDEKGSHSKRKSSRFTPNIIRKISREREIFIREGKKTLGQPEKGCVGNLFDYGNITKNKVSDFVYKIYKLKKRFVCLGGDHSITSEILKGLSRTNDKFSIIYFDAHPDFICSEKHYYGSVICDIEEFKNINLRTSIEIGVRDPEPEELINLRKSKLKSITGIDFTELNVKNVFKEIKKTVKGKVYMSIDMDVIDPAFAPGVSTPVPGGISSSDMLYLVKNISKLNLIGFDIMEITPKYDIQNRTSHLATKLIIETLAK